MLLTLHAPAIAALTPQQQPAGDIPAQFHLVRALYDYDWRDLMVPMRDDVRLHVVLLVPHGISHAPIMLYCTSYDANRITGNDETVHFDDLVRAPSLFNDVLTHGDIIAVEVSAASMDHRARIA